MLRLAVRLVSWFTLCVAATMAITFVTMSTSVTSWPWWGRLIMLVVYGLCLLASGEVRDTILRTIDENHKSPREIKEEFLKVLIPHRDELCKTFNYGGPALQEAFKEKVLK